MTTALRERPPARDHGHAPARRAMIRWTWRLFKREWRQQGLVLALLIVAIAATTIGLGVASNAVNLKADPTFGTANTVLTISGSARTIASDLATLQSRFKTIDVVAHQSLSIPGSVAAVDVRAENVNGPYVHVTVRLNSGRWPTGAGEVAVTHTLAQTSALHVGSTWRVDGRTLHVVGIVENPLNLLDQFALVAPGQANPPTSVAILLNATQGSLQSLNIGNGISRRGTGGKVASEAVTLVLGSLGLLFVGLMAVAGFTVMAQRRLRALGMLGALGATDRHLRLAMLANGAAVGATAAVVGVIVGLAGWFAFVPTLQSLAEHRVDAFSLPWWAIAAAMLLTFGTAIAAAWWPARTVARLPVVTALSGRPPRPQPAHRFAALGGVVIGTGLVLLAFADGKRVGFIIGGTVATAVGLLFLAPLAIRLVPLAVRHSTISVKLAVRDLARYQARSGAALGAVTLAVGIAATISVSAAAAMTPTGAGNLPSNQLMLYLTPTGNENPVPPLTTGQQQTVNTNVTRLAATIHATHVLPLDEAYNPNDALQPSQSGPSGGTPAGYGTTTLARVTATSQGDNISTMITLYVATPAVLSHYGIRPTDVKPSSDIIASQTNLTGLQLFDPGQQSGPLSGTPADSAPGVNGRPSPSFPVIQSVTALPRYTSDPGTLLTSHAMQTLGLRSLPAAWLFESNKPFTTTQIATAEKAAAAAGLYVETRTVHKSLAPLRDWSTAAGILLALGVLGMTVGLIRAETANDLRTLAATGASSNTRRAITGTTAGALALLGAFLGTSEAYAALLAWNRSNLSPLDRVPVINLVLILGGLPAIATVGGWLAAGREPPVITRRPLE